MSPCVCVCMSRDIVIEIPFSFLCDEAPVVKRTVGDNGASGARMYVRIGNDINIYWLSARAISCRDGDRRGGRARAPASSRGGPRSWRRVPTRLVVGTIISRIVLSCSFLDHTDTHITYIYARIHVHPYIDTPTRNYNYSKVTCTM